MRQYIHKERMEYSSTKEYLSWLKTNFKKHISDNMKTVNYLVKEFEMKKSATVTKEQLLIKQVLLIPLKLKDYKFSDDIFKRLTILLLKKHGMMMLLDWSGSMVVILKNY
ncbi:MAG: hypothetical protein CM15mV25_0990 [uncultured marine virus]|nr:MAG: hypothetical protein CM15mV25_0990 [uncultured marine virus]